MTPTPEELVKWLRKNAKMIGPWIGPVGDADRYKREGVKYSAAADLIEAQAEALRQMREALGIATPYIMEYLDNGEGSSLHGEDYDCIKTKHSECQAALALPLTAAEQQARENAEKAELLGCLLQGEGKYSIYRSGSGFGYCLLYKDVFRSCLLKSGGTLRECLGILRSELAAKEASDGK